MNCLAGITAGYGNNVGGLHTPCEVAPQPLTWYTFGHTTPQIAWQIRSIKPARCNEQSVLFLPLSLSLASRRTHNDLFYPRRSRGLRPFSLGQADPKRKPVVYVVSLGRR